MTDSAPPTDEETIRAALKRLNPTAHTSDSSWYALERLVAKAQRPTAVQVIEESGYDALARIALEAALELLDGGDLLMAAMFAGLAKSNLALSATRQSRDARAKTEVPDAAS